MGAWLGESVRAVYEDVAFGEVIKCAILSPVPMGPTGMRNADARSTSSCTVRSLVNAHMRGQTSSRRSIRVWKLVRSSLPIQSSAPIMEQKSCHCWPVIVQNPTHPSFAGSTDGISICRVGRKSGAKWSNIGRYVWKRASLIHIVRHQYVFQFLFL